MSPERIRRAAEILRSEAQVLKRSFAGGGGDWSAPAEISVTECVARENHDEMLALAIELDLLAAGK